MVMTNHLFQAAPVPQSFLAPSNFCTNVPYL